MKLYGQVAMLRIAWENGRSRSPGFESMSDATG